MKKRKGMHYYINISNFDDVVEREEFEDGSVNHSIHALNTFYSTIEWYAKQEYGESLVVEKVTGARLHMYILEDVRKAFEIVKDVSVFALKMASYINTDVSKYKKLLQLKIKIGACYGLFYDFVFRDGDFEEETSIGYAANYAAKLQMLSDEGYISISSNVYDELDGTDLYAFSKVHSHRITKYKQSCFYTAKIVNLYVDRDLYEEAFRYADEIIHKTNLADMNYESVRSLISPNDLSVKVIKKVIGIPLFADVRGFTEKFDKDDSNLLEMAEKTQEILKAMYSVVKVNGVHIQFQGDREFALFHNYSDYKCVTDAVIAAMKIIDRVKGYRVNVGVGESFGTVFASRIGARGEKDNILIGRTVSEADRYEDDFAKENQLVISEQIYKMLEQANLVLANQFTRTEEGHYVTEVGYERFCEAVEDEKLSYNNERKTYNKAWCEQNG